MPRLIRIQLGEPLQFEQPLGVQKTVNLERGGRQLVTFQEAEDGSVFVLVHGSSYNQIHRIPEHAIVDKVYATKDANAVLAQDDDDKPELPDVEPALEIVPPAPKRRGGWPKGKARKPKAEANGAHPNGNPEEV